MKVVNFIVKIHLVHKAQFICKIALSKRSQCMYIHLHKTTKREKYAENVSYCSVTTLAGLAEVLEKKTSQESL